MCLDCVNAVDVIMIDIVLFLFETLMRAVD